MRTILSIIAVLISLSFLSGCGGIGSPPDSEIDKIINEIYSRFNRPGYAQKATMPTLINAWEDEDRKGVYNVLIGYNLTETNTMNLMTGRIEPRTTYRKSLYRFMKQGDQWSAPIFIDNLK